VSILQLNPEHRVRKRLVYDTFHFNCFFFSHKSSNSVNKSIVGKEISFVKVEKAKPLPPGVDNYNRRIVLEITSGPYFYRTIAYGQIGTDRRMHVPVKWIESPYANLRHVVGYPALRREEGLSLGEIVRLDKKLSVPDSPSIQRALDEDKALEAQKSREVKQYQNLKKAPEAANVHLFTGKLTPPPQILDFTV